MVWMATLNPFNVCNSSSFIYLLTCHLNHTLFPSNCDSRLILSKISDSVSLPTLSGEEVFLFRFTSLGLKARAALSSVNSSETK